MWLKRYSGLLRLHAALLSPAGEFLPRLENSALGQRQSSLRRSSTFLSLRAAPRRGHRLHFTITDTATPPLHVDRMQGARVCLLFS